MVEKVEILKEKLDYNGVFNFTDLYSYAYRWLNEREEFIVTEEKYSEKVTGNSREIMITWKAFRKLTEYYKVEITVDYEIYGMTDVEIDIDGKKKKSNKGKLTIKLKGVLAMDYDSKWESSAFNQFLRGLYNKYIMPGRTDQMEGRVARFVTEFKDSVKSFLEISAQR